MSVQGYFRSLTGNSRAKINLLMLCAVLRRKERCKWEILSERGVMAVIAQSRQDPRGQPSHQLKEDSIRKT